MATKIVDELRFAEDDELAERLEKAANKLVDLDARIKKLEAEQPPPGNK